MAAYSLSEAGESGIQQEIPHIFSALQVPQAFSLTRTVGKPREQKTIRKGQLKPFLDVHSQPGGSISICLKRARAGIMHCAQHLVWQGARFSLWVEREEGTSWWRGAVSVWDTDVCQSRLTSKKLDSRFLRGCWKTGWKQKVYLSFHLSKFLQFPVWSKRKQSKYLARKVNLKARGLACKKNKKEVRKQCFEHFKDKCKRIDKCFLLSVHPH